jgi:hypothetical protein
MADNTDDLVIAISTDTTTIKRALTKLVGDIDSASSQISRKFDSVGKTLDNSVTTALQARIDAMVGIGTKGANEWTGVLADQGKQLDMLRAKYNPLFATLTQYKSNLADLKRAYAVGAISSAEFTAAQSRERQATLANVAAIKAQGVAVAGHGDSSLDHGQLQALLHSARSITEQLALGASPTQAFVGQLSHLSYVASGEGGVTGALKAVGNGVLGLISKFPLVTAAIAVAGLGAAIYFATAKEKTKDLSDALADQEKVLKRIADAYGSVAENAAKAGSAESKGLVNALGNRSQASLAASTRVEASNFFSSRDVGTARAGGRFGQGNTGFIATVPAFQDALLKLRADVKNGKADFEGFYQEIERKVELDPSLRTAGDKIITETENLKKATDAAKEYQRILDALFNDRGPNGMLLSQGTTSREDSGNYAAFLAQQKVASARSRQALAAQQAGINARSPAEREEAARQTAAAQYNNDETPDARKQRIQQAGMLVQIQIQHDMAEAQRDRAVALNKTVADEQLDIDLIGKTAGEAAALRKEYELTSQLRIDAAKNGTEVDQKEIDLIKQKSKELGDLTDAYNKTNLKKDLSFERDQLFRSPQEQQVASRLQGAGQAIDLDSPQAKAIRQNLQIGEMQDTVKGFFTSIRDNVVSNGGNIGKALGDSIKTSMLNELTKASDAAIQRLTNLFVNAFLPSGNVAGGGSAAGASIAAAGVAAITGKAPVGAVTRAALPDVGAATDISSYITQAALKRGIDPSVALAVAKSEGGLKSWNMQSGYIKNGVQEPSFGPFQLYKGGGLGNEFQKQTGLDPALAQNGPAGVDFALDHAAKNGWGSWYGAKNTGISNWQGIGTDSNMNGAADAVNKLAENSKAAAASVGTFGNGLGQLGTSLSSNVFPAAPTASGGGGGLFGLLGGLFSSPFKAMGPQGAAALAGTLKPGLFADGGYTGPGGKNTPAGIVHAGEFVVPKHIVDKIGVPALSTMMKGYADGGLVTPANIAAPRAPSLTSRSATTGANSNQPGVLNVHIIGASGDDHVRMLVKQGVGDGLNQYNDSQVRGGFGTNQNRWTARKG